MINQFGADVVDCLFYQIALLRKMFSGRIAVLLQLIDFTKNLEFKFLISKRQDNKIDDKDEKFKLNLNNFIYKIDNSIQSLDLIV